MPHRRRYSRLSFAARATLVVGAEGTPAPVHVIDLSLKGALIARPEQACPLGAPAVLTIHLADPPDVIVMHGVLAHASDARVGLHCVTIDVESITHLRRLMELNLGDPQLLERELLELG